MDITKMLNISTVHITKETAELLDEVCKNSRLSNLIIYDKFVNYDWCTEHYGWFIYCDVNFADLKAPKDLIKVMCFAKDMGCDWLCIDRDYDVTDGLDIYEW